MHTRTSVCIKDLTQRLYFLVLHMSPHTLVWVWGSLAGWGGKHVSLFVAITHCVIFLVLGPGTLPGTDLESWGDEALSPRPVLEPGTDLLLLGHPITPYGVPHGVLSITLWMGCLLPRPQEGEKAVSHSLW